MLTSLFTICCKVVKYNICTYRFWMIYQCIQNGSSTFMHAVKLPTSFCCRFKNSFFILFNSITPQFRTVTISRSGSSSPDSLHLNGLINFKTRKLYPTHPLAQNVVKFSSLRWQWGCPLTSVISNRVGCVGLKCCGDRPTYVHHWGNEDRKQAFHAEVE